MGTRSTIALQNIENFYVTSIYCHWDGYLDHVGKLLLTHYNSESRVKELLALGNVSSLGPTLGEKHDFNIRNEWATTFYGRDRGETEQEAVAYASVEEWLREGCQEYNYLFVPGYGWKVAYRDTENRLVSLSQAIAEEEDRDRR